MRRVGLCPVINLRQKRLAGCAGAYMAMTTLPFQQSSNFLFSGHLGPGTPAHMHHRDVSQHTRGQGEFFTLWL